MNYFTNLLCAKAYPLRVPLKFKEDIRRCVRQHQPVSATVERAPFRRQLDFWAFSLVAAICSRLTPLESPSSKWGHKFADTKSVPPSDQLCDLLAVIAFAELGSNHERFDDPAQIIELGNQLAGAGAEVVIRRINDPDLRVVPLDKILEYATSLLQQNREKVAV